MQPLFLYRPMGGQVGASSPTFTRATAATYVNSGVNVASAANGELRNGHYAYASTQGRYYLSTLLEGARTNLCTKSQEFGDAAWSATRASVSANAATAPDGTLTADKLVEDSTAANTHNLQRTSNIVVVDATKYATTIFAKAAERSWIRLREGVGVTADAYFNLGTGAVGTVAGTGTPTARIEPLGNGWYRCDLMWTSSGTAAQIRIDLATGDGGASYNGDGVSGVYLWGADMEAGAFPSSYIPTTTAAVTRNADVLSYPFPYAPQAMTIYLRGVEAGTTQTTNAGYVQIGAAANQVTEPRILMFSSGGTAPRAVYNDNAGGSSTSTGTAASMGDLVEYRITFTGTVIQLSQCYNNGTEATAAAGNAAAPATAWAAGTVISIGSRSDGTFNGFGPYTHCLVLPGIQSLAQCRAAANV